jgi:SSS family solute:Na+ symporter
MKLGLSTLDICVVFTYLIIMLGIGGWHFLTKNKSANEFMDAGRSFSHWPLGLSIFASWMSNIAIISMPALVYSGNWSYFIMFMGIPITAIFVIRILIPIYHKEGSVSAYSYLGTRFGSWAPFCCVIAYALINLFRLGIIMYLMSTAIGSLSGYQAKSVILIVGGIVVLYTFAGGIKTVIFTDVIQAVLFFSGTVLLLAFIIYSLPCTFEEALIYANQNGKFGFGSTNMSFVEESIWILAFNALLFNFEGLGTEQGFVQRYMAAKDEQAAKKSAIIGSLLIFVFASILFVIGTLLFVHYNYGVGLIDNVIDGEYVMLRYISDHIPLGLRGIIIVTIMAAAMSSIDTEINSIATIVYKHIYKKIFNKFEEKSDELFTLYKICIVIGIIPIMVAFLLTEKSSLLKSTLFSTWDEFNSLISGVILGLFMLALVLRRCEKSAAVFGMAFGLGVLVWAILSQTVLDSFSNPLHPVFNIFLLLSVMLISGWVAHRVISRRRLEAQLVE